MRRFMLGNMNPKMAATVFCSALLLLPKTKCRQNMEKRMENSTSHETCSKRYSSGGIASKKKAKGQCLQLGDTVLLEVNICFHPKFILLVNSHLKPFKMRYIS